MERSHHMALVNCSALLIEVEVKVAIVGKRLLLEVGGQAEKEINECCELSRHEFSQGLELLLDYAQYDQAVDQFLSCTKKSPDFGGDF